LRRRERQRLRRSCFGSLCKFLGPPPDLRRVTFRTLKIPKKSTVTTGIFEMAGMPDDLLSI
jgi:hypothetical protein